tara:strand:+ start:726 stop:1226 length:501 start_codon:yes stop_codon:yes gene_type:complete
MKNTFFLLLLFPFILQAQQGANRESFKVNGQSIIGDTKEQVITAIGKPDKVSDDFNEMDDIPVQKLHYGKSILWFERGRLVSWTIKDEQLLLVYNDLTIKVGEPAKILEKPFPKAYEGQNSPGRLSVRLQLSSSVITGEEGLTDEFINFYIDPVSLNIEEIILSSY